MSGEAADSAPDIIATTIIAKVLASHGCIWRQCPELPKPSISLLILIDRCLYQIAFKSEHIPLENISCFNSFKSAIPYLPSLGGMIRLCALCANTAILAHYRGRPKWLSKIADYLATLLSNYYEEAAHYKGGWGRFMIQVHFV